MELASENLRKRIASLDPENPVNQSLIEPRQAESEGCRRRNTLPRFVLKCFIGNVALKFRTRIWVKFGVGPEISVGLEGRSLKSKRNS